MKKEDMTIRSQH